MKKKYIIWDFDGTLANTNDVILDSWKAAFEHFLGAVPSDEEIIGTFGETLRHTIAVRFPGETYEDVRDYYRAYQEAHSEGRVYVYEGIRELLDELKARGCGLGVATSRTAYSYSNYMSELGLEGYMDVVVSMEDVAKHKPDPESIEKVLEKFGAQPGEAVMIGDSRYDMGCANNAGVDSVMVGWSHPVDIDAMTAEGFAPKYYIDKPSDLLDILDIE